MRKVTFGVANSLDNYIARNDHSVDWLRFSKEVQDYISEYWKSIDTVLIGRRSYEAAGGHGAYPGVDTYLFSTTLKQVKGKRVHLVSENAGEFVRELKQRPGKDICVMGGGLLAKSLFDAGVIDEVGVNIHPILLGSGIPLFHPLEREVNLELTEVQRFPKDCMLLLYRVVPAPVKTPRSRARVARAKAR